MNFKIPSFISKEEDNQMIKDGLLLKTINMKSKVDQFKKKQAEYLIS